MFVDFTFSSIETEFSDYWIIFQFLVIFLFSPNWWNLTCSVVVNGLSYAIMPEL